MDCYCVGDVRRKNYSYSKTFVSVLSFISGFLGVQRPRQHLLPNALQRQDRDVPHIRAGKGKIGKKNPLIFACFSCRNSTPTPTETEDTRPS